jgi:hypothetical protein
MSDDVTKLVSQIKTATDYQVNRRILREKIQSDLQLTYNGGLFTVTPALLAFLSSWPIDDLIIEDAYQNPIQIDKQIFLVQCQQHYYRVMNTWHEQHAELKLTRKI